MFDTPQFIDKITVNFQVYDRLWDTIYKVKFTGTYKRCYISIDNVPLPFNAFIYEPCEIFGAIKKKLFIILASMSFRIEEVQDHWELKSNF